MDTHEVYVSLTTARKLKEIGFNWATIGYYNVEKDELKKGACSNDFNKYDDLIGSLSRSEICSAPTLAVAMKWLREEKGYCVEATGFNLTKFVGSFYIQDDGREFRIFDNAQEPSSKYKLKQFDTYESAIEETIQECINFILEQQNENKEE